MIICILYTADILILHIDPSRARAEAWTPISVKIRKSHASARKDRSEHRKAPCRARARGGNALWRDDARVRAVVAFLQGIVNKRVDKRVYVKPY